MAHWGSSFRPGSCALRASRPDGQTQEFAIDEGDFKIGSEGDADLRVEGPGIKAQHCRLSLRKGVLTLYDRGSELGTTINLRPCTEPTILREGDRIGVGSTVIEVLPARTQLSPERIAAQVRQGPGPWALDEGDERRRELLAREAERWHTSGRPRRLLPAPHRLPAIVALDRRGPLDADVRAWVEAAALRKRRAQGLRWLLAGALLGCVAAGQLARPSPAVPAPAPPSPPVPPAPPAPTPPPGPPPRLQSIAHTVIPGETLADVAALYEVSPQWLAQWNDLRVHTPLSPGQRLQVRTTRPPVEREPVTLTLESGDTWAGVARRFGVDVARLQAANPEQGAVLQPGARIVVWAPRRDDPRPRFEPAPALVPTDATSTGRTHAGGSLDHALQLPASPDYDLRCPMNAHASSFTAGRLLTAMTRLRAHYRGQIVLGDLSRGRGGAFGKHRSHQSGRDVDIWLPIVGGRYRSAPECEHCGTPWCRPDPAEVDWRATWDLIAALRDTGGVRQIFLDRSLHAELRAAAREAGLDEPALDRAVQRRRGAAALVTHSPGHLHHIHVRFRCGPDEPDCED